MEGKTLFLKFNTGPSGHGSPAAAGEALALKRAGAEGGLRRDQERDRDKRLARLKRAIAEARGR